MTVLYLGDLAAIALSLPGLMAGAPRLGSHIAVRMAGITDNPRHAVFARGLPPLEQQMLRSRFERYRGYQPRTSMFVPLPRQKGVIA
jgi:steroid 5-alpha reductase family enzyme